MDDIENLVDDLENLVDKFRAWPWVTEKDQNFMKKTLISTEKKCAFLLKEETEGR